MPAPHADHNASLPWVFGTTKRQREEGRLHPAVWLTVMGCCSSRLADHADLPCFLTLPAVPISGSGPGLAPGANATYQLVGIKEGVERISRGAPAAKGLVVVQDSQGSWGAVCASEQTSAAEARAACRGLGWTGRAGAYEFAALNRIGDSTWPEDLPELKVAWSTVNCTGTEASLMDCAYQASNWQAWGNGTIAEVCRNGQRLLMAFCAEDPGAWLMPLPT